MLKVGRFSCPVKKVTPKYGSTVKNFRLESWPKIFLWPSIHVGCMPFHFRQNFQLKIFHRHRQRHRHPCPVHFCKNEKVEEKNYLKIEKKGGGDGDVDGEKFLTGNFPENEMACSQHV